MAFERCIQEIQKAVGEKPLTDSELTIVTDRLESVVKRLQRNKPQESLDDALLKEIDKIVGEIKLAAIIEKRNALKNAKAISDYVGFIWDGWRDDPAEGLWAFWGGSVTGRRGSKNSVGYDQDGLANFYVQTLIGKLTKAELFREATSGEFDLDVFKAMRAFEEDDREALKTISKQWQTIAKIISEMNERVRLDANKAGAWIRKDPGYVARRSHDQFKIGKAAGSHIPYGDSRHRDAWVKFMQERLDWDKTFSDIPLERRGALLQENYLQLASGIHVKFNDGGPAGFKGLGNIGKRLSQDRVYHFKDAASEYEYMRRFGGEKLIDSVYMGMQYMAQDIALMRRAGPNAIANHEEVARVIKQRLVREGDQAGLEKFSGRLRKLEEELLPNITGETNVIANKSFASASKNLRDFERIVDLGAVVLASVPDIGIIGATARRQGTSMFRGIGQAIASLFDGKPDAERVQLAGELSVVVESLRGSPASRFDAKDLPSGALAKATAHMFKLNLLRWYEDRLRVGFQINTSMRLANVRGIEFESLPMRDLLKQYDIGEKEWSAIRNAVTRTDSEGRVLLTPESVQEMFPQSRVFYVISEKRIDAINTSKKIKAENKPAAIERALEDARDEVVRKLRAYFFDQAHTAILEPDKITRSILLRGTKPGTEMGELRRHFFLYKSFMAAFMRQVLGREIWGYGLDRLPLHKQLWAMLKDPGGSASRGLANLVVFNLALGYVSIILKDLVKGRQPSIPEDAEGYAKLFARSFTAGGGAGIYGELLFNQTSAAYGHGPLETFLGPTYRRFSDIYGLFQAAKEGDPLAAKGVRLIYNNVPNLFYTKWATDYLIFYQMMEWANPGYLRRMETNLREERGQEFFVPPSEVLQ